MMVEGLRELIDGELCLDRVSRVAYSTDASIYRKIPLGVVYPKHRDDLIAIVRYCSGKSIPLIPRGGGTSLAGQCVGEGLVVDVSRYLNSVLNFDSDGEWVEVEPGLIRDELNRWLEPRGFFFGPNTSTASRCNIGGMIGNNSCGTTSIKYGSTRDKVLEIEAILSDGSIAVFGGKTDHINPLQQEIEERIIEMLGPIEVQREIEAKFPKRNIHRRNTGYALDAVLEMQPFSAKGDSLNFSKLIAGSEGTLCIITKARLRVDRLPPKEAAVICAHFATMRQAMEATVIAMKSQPFACELMDRTILELTKGNLEQAENRFFVEGDPAAIIAIELRSETDKGLAQLISGTIKALADADLGYAYPVIYPPQIKNVWDLRAAGLGVLSNMPGKAKPIAFVEDTAVDLNDLPDYIDEFEQVMVNFGQKAVYYAHAGAGELHLRPILNLKEAKGVQDLRAIATASAELVKRYRGSLSGEHGDGRVRAEFISGMVGENNYLLIQRLKQIWDPKNIFNPGKIVDALPMDSDLRYSVGQKPFTYPTFLRFEEGENMLESAERCNGSGDCRKLPAAGGTMCPSYHATKDEIHTTRARANVLREMLTHPHNSAYPVDSPEIAEVLDLCISCKACKRECPSSVDMAALKAEAMYQIQRRHGTSSRSRFFGMFHHHAGMAAPFAPILNFVLKKEGLNRIFKTKIGIALGRSIPPFSVKTATNRLKRYSTKKGSVDFVLYIDEFTQYQDSDVALDAAKLLTALGYKFRVYYAPSARAAISKSLLEEARVMAHAILDNLKGDIEKSIPIVGLEPSTILGFRDEFPKLVSKEFEESAKGLAQISKTFEEFLYYQWEDKKIDRNLFTDNQAEIHLHLHCHQKALSHVKYSKEILKIPKNYSVQLIPSGCCGMAGSFGYEEEHFEVSMKIGELVLFPYLKARPEAIVVAAGTSCRHQIKDGTGMESIHPATALLKALK